MSKEVNDYLIVLIKVGIYERNNSDIFKKINFIGKFSKIINAI